MISSKIYRLFELCSCLWYLYIEKKQDLFLPDPENKSVPYQELIKKDDVVIEIGVRFGGLTTRLAKMGSLVYSFEPNFLNYQILKAHLRKQKISNVIPIRKKIGDGRKHTKTIDSFHIPNATVMVLDCETYESALLANSPETLKSVHTIVVETHFLNDREDTMLDVWKILSERGFVLNRIIIKNYVPIPQQDWASICLFKKASISNP